MDDNALGPTDLIKNGSFEDAGSDPTKPDGWDIEEGGFATVTIDDSEVTSGLHVAKVSAKAADFKWLFVHLRQNYIASDFVVGATYRLSYFLKHDTLVDNQDIYITFDYDAPEFEVVSIQNISGPAAAQDWIQQSIVFTITSSIVAKAIAFHVGFYPENFSGQSFNFWVDDVLIERIK